MKPRAPEDREEALVALLRRFYDGELSDGELLRALRREVLGLSPDPLCRPGRYQPSYPV